MAYLNGNSILTTVRVGYANENELLAKTSAPNLLINSNFAINQRGESSYTTTNAYTVDRWCMAAGATSVAPTTNGISVVTNGSTNVIYQDIERDDTLYARLLSEDVTISASIDDTIISVTGTMPSAISATGNIFSSDYTNGLRLRLTIQGSNLRIRVVIDSNTSDTYVINWVKFEIGDVATTYTPPLIAEELLKCQRYYQRLYQGTGGYGYPCIAVGYATTTTTLAFSLALATALRTAPTITYDALYYRYGTSTSNIQITGINTPDYAVGASQVGITVTGASSLTIGNAGFLQVRSGGVLEIDAEIY